MALKTIFKHQNAVRRNNTHWPFSKWVNISTWIDWHPEHPKGWRLTVCTSTCPKHKREAAHELGQLCEGTLSQTIVDGCVGAISSKRLADGMLTFSDMNEVNNYNNTISAMVDDLEATIKQLEELKLSTEDFTND